MNLKLWSDTIHLYCKVKYRGPRPTNLELHRFLCTREFGLQFGHIPMALSCVEPAHTKTRPAPKLGFPSTDHQFRTHEIYIKYHTLFKMDRNAPGTTKRPVRSRYTVVFLAKWSAQLERYLVEHPTPYVNFAALLVTK